MFASVIFVMRKIWRTLIPRFAFKILENKVPFLQHEHFVQLSTLYSPYPAFFLSECNFLGEIMEKR